MITPYSLTSFVSVFFVDKMTYKSPDFRNDFIPKNNLFCSDKRMFIILPCFSASFISKQSSYPMWELNFAAQSFQMFRGK